MFRIFKYVDLPNYLLRWTIIKAGSLHLRIHQILTEDKTPFLHNHPFHYVSIILSGGYTEHRLTKQGALETIHHTTGSVIIRSREEFHRIHSVNPNCRTLFLAIGKGGWDLATHKDIPKPAEYVVPAIPGVYLRWLSGKLLYARFDKYWRIGCLTRHSAEQEERPSVHQVGAWHNSNT